MKTQIKNIKTQTTLKLLLLVIAAILLLITSCKKTPPVIQNNSNIIQLTNTEQALLGKWQMKKNEIYEIDGVDSTGQYICSLISTENCDSACRLQFKHEYNPQLADKQLRGTGSVGECDSTRQFLWNAKRQNAFEILCGPTYNIVYLTNDSVVFSRIYTKDILQLKSMSYYKRFK